MCLDIIKTPKKLKGEGTGYKLFNKTSRGNLYFAYNVGKKVPLPVGKWINEKDYRGRWSKDTEKILAWGRLEYPMGFHIYRSKKMRKTFIYCGRVVIPVKFRKACAKGVQGRKNVIVAKEIFIPKEA